jgi:hypothetical protein
MIFIFDSECIEYDIIFGVRKQISANVIGVRVEVSFAHIFAGKPFLEAFSKFLL